MYNPYDHYFNKAKKEWYKARSAFKLEAIQDKFHIFDKNVRTVIDVWCAPGSWLQYASSQLEKFTVSDPILLWFDLKPVKISLPHMFAYKQDITDRVGVQRILTEHSIDQVDCIISDMAPNTIGVKDIDAIRSFDLLEKSFWMYEELLKKNGKFVVKVFMGTGFDEYVKKMKDLFGGKNIKIFKPDASRTNSKETYVIKV
jgi:23S rRNA (uridine2552-2'-O)-methyltransferase